MKKKTVALTGASGTMGFQGFLELYAKKNQFDIVLLLRDSKKNREKSINKLIDTITKEFSEYKTWKDLWEDIL